MEFLSIRETNKNKVVTVETFPTATVFREVISAGRRKEPLYGPKFHDSEMRTSVAVTGE